jgi:hypothetical protein
MSLDWPFTIAWGVIVGAGLIVEGIAIARKRKGDTASEHVWWLLRRRKVYWFVAAGLLLWTVLHFLGFGIV